MMGRKRTLLASRMAASAVLPAFFASRAKSIIMIAFFFTTPTSISRPT